MRTSVSGRTLDLMTSPQPPGGARATSRSTSSDPTRMRRARLVRDEALQKSRSITKGIAVASVAAVAAFAAYVSHAFPGHSSTPAGSSITSTQPSGTTGSGPTSGGAQSSGVAPPASAPASSNNQAPVVSGAT